MFRKNDRHLQPILISNVNDLPEIHRKRLEGSWHRCSTKRPSAVCNEHPVAVLYADIPSRSNIPIKVLVGLESLKADFGWSDKELYDVFT